MFLSTRPKKNPQAHRPIRYAAIDVATQTGSNRGRSPLANIASLARTICLPTAAKTTTANTALTIDFAVFDQRFATRSSPHRCQVKKPIVKKTGSPSALVGSVNESTA